ncbi:MAG: metallophosphoesterase family protein, partial [Sulfolobales archaeon]
LGLRRIAERNGSEIYDPPHVLLLGGRKILLLHGVGPADESREYAEALASSGYYDVVLYGHTHVIDSRMIKSTLLLNPGELYGYLTGRSSIAILDLQKMDVEIVIL